MNNATLSAISLLPDRVLPVDVPCVPVSPAVYRTAQVRSRGWIEFGAGGRFGM